MEVVWDVFAGCPAWCKFHLAKTISSAGRHRAALTSCRVIQDDLQSMGSVVQGDNNRITRIHEQVRRWIGGEPGCGCPLFVMNAKLTYSTPVLAAQVGFSN